MPVPPEPCAAVTTLRGQGQRSRKEASLRAQQPLSLAPLGALSARGLLDTALPDNERPLVELDLPPGQPSQQAVRNRGQAERRLGRAGRHEAGVSWSSQPRRRAPPRQGPAPASLAWGLLGVLSCGAMGKVGRTPLATPPEGPDKAPALWSALPGQKGHPQALRPWARLSPEPLGEGCMGARRQLPASGLVSRVPSGPPRGQR